MPTLNGVQTSNKLEWMDPILKNWIRLYRRYSEWHPGDAPFIFYERAAVGVFSAACWAEKNGYSVQEYATRKQVEANAEERKYGRDDLYFGVKDRSVVAEAKVSWVCANPLNEGSIGKGLTKATEGAERCYGGYSKFRAGMVCCNFWVNERKCNSTLSTRSMINDCIDAVKSVPRSGSGRSAKVSARAWHFTTDRDKWFKNHRSECYFGSALLFSLV